MFHKKADTQNLTRALQKLPAHARVPGTFGTPGRSGTSAGEFRTSVYPGHLPSFVGPTLERIYGSLYASLPQLEVEGDGEGEGSTRGINTYVAQRGTEIIDLWLYRVNGHEVRVMNEAIAVTAPAVQRFAQKVFALHPDARRIVFHAVRPETGGLGLPFQRFPCSDDSVLLLPPDEAAYLAQLGKATRKNIRRALQRIEQALPGFRYDIYERDAIPDAMLRAIVAFNRQRMLAKGKQPGIDAVQEERMLRLARRSGLIGVATVDGAVCGGAIVYQVGANYFSFVRAHDPAYDEYGLGLAGAWHLIRSCIARGGRELHFMWGREPHKALLGAELRELEHLLVFRSRLHALRDLRLIAQNATACWLQGTKRRLLERAQGNDRLALLLQGARKAVRKGVRPGPGP